MRRDCSAGEGPLGIGNSVVGGCGFPGRSTEGNGEGGPGVVAAAAVAG